MKRYYLRNIVLLGFGIVHLVAEVIALHHDSLAEAERGAIGEDHHPRAEQQFEHAARGAVRDHFAQPPRDLVGLGPAEVPEIAEHRPERAAHVVDVHEQDAQDRDPPEDVENRDTRRAIGLRRLQYRWFGCRSA
jgi:hypothetical protein